MFLSRNKRGDAPSVFIIIVVLFLVAITGVVFTAVFAKTLNGMLATEQVSSNPNAVSSITQVRDSTAGYLDYVFLFTLLALLLGMIVASVFVSSHAVFVPIQIIVILVAVTLSAVLANVYFEVTSDPQLADTAAKFTFTQTLINIFPYMILIVGIITFIVLYGKRSTGEGMVSYG